MGPAAPAVHVLLAAAAYGVNAVNAVEASNAFRFEGSNSAAQWAWISNPLTIGTFCVAIAAYLLVHHQEWVRLTAVLERAARTIGLRL